MRSEMSMKKFIILAILFSISYILNPSLTSAVTCPTGSVCLENPLIGDVTSAKVIIGTLIKGVLAILGSITLFMLIWGGFQWLTSAGSSEKVQKGTSTMLWALIGLVVIFSAYILISTLTNLLSGK